MVSFLFLVGLFLSLKQTEQSSFGENDIPAALGNVGVGYNILRGNPDGNDWRHGGEDPGLLVTRRILTLNSEGSNLPDQLVYTRHESCQTSATDRLIYSPKSYQNHLGQRITFAGTAFPSLRAAEFTLSSAYFSVKRETDTLFYVLQDSTSTCVNGTARYMINLASVNSYQLSDEFMTDVCALPEEYNADQYVHFIEKWGTHVVTGMKLGYRETTMTIGTRTEYIKTVMEKSKKDVSVGGPLYNHDESWVVDLDTFMLRPTFPINVGNTTYKLATGNKDSPEPIGLNLTSIDTTFTSDFWTIGRLVQSQCPNNITSTLSKRKENLVKALQTYATTKGAETPRDETLAIPVVWPTGTFGLPKPKDGFPISDTLWMEGWLRQNPETQTPDSSWNISQLDGFSEGFVQWDDEDTNNANEHGGVLPDGIYGSDIRMKYCCRTSDKVAPDNYAYSYNPCFPFTVGTCANAAQTEQSSFGQNDIPAALGNVGVGYNILRGNPDGNDWRHGGEDPGLLVTRRILTLDSEVSNLPDQLVYTRHESCQTSATDRLIYSSKSYQDHLGQRITVAGTAFPSLQAAEFTLSSAYLNVKRETDTLFYVLQDSTSTCVKGTARYMINLASVNLYQLSDEFMTDVCALPEEYNTDQYVHFIEKWGTHVVTGIKLGYRETTMTIGTRTEYIKTVMEKSKKDVSVGGPLNNHGESLVVDLDTFMLRPTFPITVGNTTYKLVTGNKNSPEPIGLNLTSIDTTFTSDFWTNGKRVQSQCPSNIISTLSKRKENLVKALQTYATSKGTETPRDETLSIPVVWPTGTFGLPKPKDGCPISDNLWMEGWLRQNPETQTPDSAWNISHLDATMSKTIFLLHFCIKLFTHDEFSIDWPAGDYCIFKFKNCPAGFSEGFVQWDDEDKNNANEHGGVLPDGIYGSDIRMKYCCRSDGGYYDPITLPTDTPFYLFQYKNSCQAVRGMTSTVEYIFWDDEDSKSTTSADIGDVHPGMVFCNPPKYPGGCTASRIYYCYYKKESAIPGITG